MTVDPGTAISVLDRSPHVFFAGIELKHVA